MVDKSCQIITLFPSCWILLNPGIFEWDKIHPLAHPSGPSNVPRDSSGKMTLKKSLFMYFLDKFWHFKIFALGRGDCQGAFLNIYSTPFVLFESLDSSLFNDLSAGESDRFPKTRFSLRSSLRSDSYKLFPLLWDLQWYLQTKHSLRL